jgi:glycerol-1-phosphate dehydrogenase [NAD(P)+]
MKYARIEQVREIEALSADVDGILSVGTGSLNDICRVASFYAKKELCIFATAPSMDGFASDSAPIITGNFKESKFVEQPRIIIADTKILAASPVELKAAGFGDMVAKYIGIFEWRLANLLIGEYYCENIAKMSLDAVGRMVALADKVTADDEETAGAIMEALVLSGLAMKLAGCSRPASGAEHVISHYWECYKLARGIWPEFHGKKVGVASLVLIGIIHNLVDRLEEIETTEDKTDWEKVYGAFDQSQLADVKRLNSPTITDKVDPERLREIWPEVRRIAREVLPARDELEALMKAAGCATTIGEINVSDELFELGLRYHAYMRQRLLTTRIFPMMGVDIMEYVDRE